MTTCACTRCAVEEHSRLSMEIEQSAPETATVTHAHTDSPDLLAEVHRLVRERDEAIARADHKSRLAAEHMVELELRWSRIRHVERERDEARAELADEKASREGWEAQAFELQAENERLRAAQRDLPAVHRDRRGQLWIDRPGKTSYQYDADQGSQLAMRRDADDLHAVADFLDAEAARDAEDNPLPECPTCHGSGNAPWGDA